MTLRAVPFIVVVATIGLWSAVGATARAEEDNPAALAAAIKNATATLQGGLKAMRRKEPRSRPNSRSRTESCNCQSTR